jgi:hypothetical protein
MILKIYLSITELFLKLIFVFNILHFQFLILPLINQIIIIQELIYFDTFLLYYSVMSFFIMDILLLFSKLIIK